MPHTPPKSGPFAHPTSQDLGGLGVSFPVSFAQQRVWFLHYLEPTIASYNLPVAVRLTGPLDVGALEESLSEVVKRHDALRTSFPVYEGRPVQVIAPVRQVALLEIDLSGVPLGDAWRGGRPSGERRSEPTLRPGAGTALPREALFVSAEERARPAPDDAPHRLRRLVDRRARARACRALRRRSRRASRSPLPRAADPVRRLRRSGSGEWLQRRACSETQLAYWKRAAGRRAARRSSCRPTGPRPAVQTFARGARAGCALPPGADRERLQALGQARGRDAVHDAARGVPGAPAARYTGQDDIVVGSPIAGRTGPRSRA